MHGRGRLVLTLLILAASAYAVIVGFVYLGQEKILFPAYLVAPMRTLPPGAQRLTMDAPDGTRLEGVRIPAGSGPRSATLLLVFVGNASNAQAVAELIHEYHPAHDVVAFFYRGYAPSGGSAGARALMEDAPFVYDQLVARLRPESVIAVGISLGSGVAASLAARRPLAGLILVTPFDSLSATARQLHPWLPVSLLLRHDMPSADLLRGTRTPVAIIAAGRDRLVRPERTDALRDAVGNLVFDANVPGARHDDIFFHPEFKGAMRSALARIEMQQP